MATLSSAALDIARIVTRVIEGTATGGSTTTLIDTAFAYKPDRVNVPADDYYNGGTIWFLSGSLNGKSAVVADWARATQTVTFATQTASASGAQYAICDLTYPRYVLWQAVNDALANIGGEDKYNISRTTVADQMSYDLPGGVYNVLKLEIATSKSAPYRYVEIPAQLWHEMGDAINFAEGRQPTMPGYIIRLTYRTPLATLSADSGVVPRLYDPNLVKWMGAAYCYRWRYQQVKQDEPTAAQFLQEAMAQAQQMAARYMPKLQRARRAWEHSAFDLSNAPSNDPGPGLVRL